MKTLLGLLLATLCILAFVVVVHENRSSPSAIDEIKRRGVLRVAVLTDDPPFGFLDSNGVNQGYEIYFAKRLAKELLGDENKIKFYPTTIDGRLATLESDSVDIVFARYTVTDDRRSSVDFCLPFYKTAIGVVSREDDPIRAVSQLEGQKLIVLSGSTAEEYFAAEHPSVELLRFAEVEAARSALKNGEARAMTDDNKALLAWIVQNNGYWLGIGSLGKVTPIAPAVKKGNTELRDYVNELFFKLGKERFALTAFYATLQPYYGSRVAPENIVIEGGMY